MRFRIPEEHYPNLRPSFWVSTEWRSYSSRYSDDYEVQRSQVSDSLSLLGLNALDANNENLYILEILLHLLCTIKPGRERREEFTSCRWVHDYQDACMGKVVRFIEGELNRTPSLPASVKGHDLTSKRCANLVLSQLSARLVKFGSSFPSCRRRSLRCLTVKHPTDIHNQSPGYWKRRGASTIDSYLWAATYEYFV